MHAKLRRAKLGEHLREGRGSREAGTQTEASVPEEAGTPPPFRSQLSAQTPRQRAESVLQTQPQVWDCALQLMQRLEPWQSHACGGISCSHCGCIDLSVILVRANFSGLQLIRLGFCLGNIQAVLIRCAGRSQCAACQRSDAGLPRAVSRGRCAC